MRKGILAAAVMTLGLVAVPSFVEAGPGPQQRTETRTTGHQTRTEVRDVRPASHEVIRDEHVRRDDHPIIRDEHRDVRIDEHVVVDHDRHWDYDRHWNRDHVEFVPAPVVITPPVYVAPYTDTPVAINQVPPAVLNAAAQQSGGAPIVGVDFVQNAGGTFYDVHVTAAYNTLQTLRFGINGGFFGNV